MPKTINIRNLDDEVYLVLKRRAKAAGISIPELFRRHMQLMVLRDQFEEASRRPMNRNNTPGGSR